MFPAWSLYPFPKCIDMEERGESPCPTTSWRGRGVDDPFAAANPLCSGERTPQYLRGAIEGVPRPTNPVLPKPMTAVNVLPSYPRRRKAASKEGNEQKAARKSEINVTFWRLSFGFHSVTSSFRISGAATPTDARAARNVVGRGGRFRSSTQQ